MLVEIYSEIISAFFKVSRNYERVIKWVIKSRIMRLAGHVARIGERRGVYRSLVGKPEGNKPLVRPRSR